MNEHVVISMRGKWSKVVAPRIELGALWLSAGAGQPARDYHWCMELGSSSCGIRTHLSALKERNPRPIDERAVSGRATAAQWIVRRSNPRLPVFSRALGPSQLPIQFDANTKKANKKSPASSDTGLWKAPSDLGQVSPAQRMRKRIRRLIGGAAFAQATLFAKEAERIHWPQNRHGTNPPQIPAGC